MKPSEQNSREAHTHRDQAGPVSLNASCLYMHGEDDMTHPYRRFATAVTLIAICAPYAHAQNTSALRDSDTQLHLRTRFEDVSQDGVENSNALTHRTRLTYQSGRYQGFGLLLEMDDIRAITDVDYNDGTGIYPGTAVIADPEGTEVNQSYLSYQAADTEARYGRQRIILDNQRFVGNVGWRQNEQTYDALSLRTQAIEDFTLFYAYVHNVNRVFGELTADGNHKHKSHLLNARYSGSDFGSLVAYGYMLDNEDTPALSSDTFGVRWEGVINQNVSYNLEYATQSDADDNPTSYSADYLMAEALVSTEGFNIKVGYEVLGSDGGAAAFSTPLATLHGFQGWTDKFLGTPANGVEDLYFSAGHTLGPVDLSLVYHHFSANEGGMDYGSEWGIVAGSQLGPVGLTVKYADYNADEFATDTRKLWLMATASF